MATDTAKAEMTREHWWYCSYHDTGGRWTTERRSAAGARAHFQAAKRRDDVYYCEPVSDYTDVYKVGYRTVRLVSSTGSVLWER